MGWLDDPWDRMTIQSAVRRSIDAKFRAHGVTIPFPQRDVHIVPGAQTAAASVAPLQEGGAEA